jgi:Glu-tRNA(Gln) amidotransferase subunit E-like FAD-binding protein
MVISKLENEAQKMKRATIDLTDAEYKYLVDAASNVSKHELRRCGISELIRFLIEQDMNAKSLYEAEGLYSLKSEKK